MTANHFDQIAEWYENAERITKTNLPRAGDIIIQPFPIGDGYQIEVDPEDWTPGIVREVGEHARILSRAPKPKPAWHDAPAVRFTVLGEHYYVLRTDREDEDDPGIYGYDDNEAAWYYDTSDADVTPLIVAEVTDEMIDRAFRSHVVPHLSERELREFLTDVLGIEVV